MRKIVTRARATELTMSNRARARRVVALLRRPEETTVYPVNGCAVEIT